MCSPPALECPKANRQPSMGLVYDTGSSVDASSGSQISQHHNVIVQIFTPGIGRTASSFFGFAAWDVGPLKGFRRDWGMPFFAKRRSVGFQPHRNGSRESCRSIITMSCLAGSASTQAGLSASQCQIEFAKSEMLAPDTLGSRHHPKKSPSANR